VTLAVGQKPTPEPTDYRHIYRSPSDCFGLHDPSPCGIVRYSRTAVLAALLFALAGTVARADSTWVYAVQISASAQASPPQITLNWQPDQYGANSYTVYRKRPSDSSWGSGTTLPGTSTSYVDSNVSVGSAYEYQIVKAASLGYTGYGYIYAGLNAPMTEDRGKAVLVVDNTYAAQLTNELGRLQSDLTGDGWTVVRRDVSRSDTPANVKSAIQAVYSSDPANVKAVFLFGHVPILRSGNLNIDGHQARALPADGYYGDMDGAWNNQSYLPSDVELMVGRVDLANMPGVGASNPWPSEVELLRNYLNKDHNWRHKLLQIPTRALLGNRFGDFGGEAFAASGFRNFEPLVGPGTVTIANEQDSAPADQRWSSMLGAGTYLWAYGCGGGSYTSMSAMGTHGQFFDAWSTDLVGQDAKAVFYMMFGSWLGEWDSSDNLMRSVLATPTLGLTCSWAGRPHWYYHHMGLGEPIGYSARLSQNNSGLYQNQINNFLRGIHIALMGDPTLRLHPFAPPTNLRSSTNASVITLNWSPSTDSVLGYHVYRSASMAGPFTRVSSSIITGNNFTDSSQGALTSSYMVRAVRLETTPSGTYTNQSQGAFIGGTGGGGGTPESLTVAVSRADTGVKLTWTTQIGQTYRVMTKTNLASPTWDQIGANITATSLTNVWIDTTAPSNSGRFYRIQSP